MRAKSTIISVILPLVSLFCYAETGFEQLNRYQITMEEGEFEDYSKLANIGTNILERCKSDPDFLDTICKDYKKEALDGNNLPALALATYLHDFIPDRGKGLLLELAERGDADAMTLVAVLYYASDKKSALKWLRKAAEKENQHAIARLFSDYENELTKEESLRYINWLAEQGNKGALLLLASFYMSGDGVEVNLEKAVELTKKAWSQGAVEAGLILALLYKDEDSKTSLSWMKKGAEAGDRIAQYEWAEILFAGEYTKKNENEGLRWLRLSAEAGYPVAQIKMGQVYYKGRLVEKNNNLALRWYKKAAEQGDVQGQYNVGTMFMIQRKGAEAYHWFWLASQQGHTNAVDAVRHLETFLSTEKIESVKEEGLQSHR